ncbi:MAG: ABC transporter permease [Mesorhizobium sp.]
MFESILLTIATAATPLLLAAIGELVAERSGVLNLGVEGMMLMGAVVGFGAALTTGNPWIGVLAAIIAGALFSLLFGFLALTLATNQVATGLALTLLGIGLSGMIGEAFVGQPGVKLTAIYIPGLTDLPFGRFLFGQDPLFYISILLVIGVSWFLFRTRAGLTLRSIGDSHSSAHALGIKVIAIRYAAVAFGGACAGLAGAQMSLVYTSQWIENMTAGRGWIALALVVFASWRPGRVLFGAYLFGAITIAQLHIQALSVNDIPALSGIMGMFSETARFVLSTLKSVPTQFLSALPYLATVIVLVLISRNRRLTLINTPACLGRPFVPDR